MIEVEVNGELRRVEAGNVAELLVELGFDAKGRGLAVAIAGDVVPKSRWQETPVSAGSAIEIVGAAQGG